MPDSIPSRADELDYALPPELIAQTPSAERDGARMLVLDRATAVLADDRFRELGSYLRAGDLLVFNDTRVVPAKFSARRSTGGRVEGLFLRVVDPNTWEVMLNGAGRLRQGERVELDSTADDSFEFLRHEGGGRCVIRVQSGDDTETILQRIGKTPLPPYIRREPDDSADDQLDSARYQTVFAARAGAVAAPTAGLHFTDDMTAALAREGVDHTFVTLHVGLGTFSPVAVERLADHRMHAEWYEISEESAGLINSRRAAGDRIVAVGTTSVRVLETQSGPSGVSAGAGWTDIFIRPPYAFRTVDALLTNFHLPRSTLLALVAAFVGTDRILRAYEHAVQERYRFYSYGDAMLIL